MSDPVVQLVRDLLRQAIRDGLTVAQYASVESLTDRELSGMVNLIKVVMQQERAQSPK